MTDDETRAVLDAETIEKAARALFEEGHSDPAWSWADVVREEGSRAEIWREDASRVLIASGLLDRLRAAEAERERYREKWLGVTLGNTTLIDDLAAAEARAAESEAVIAEAPHSSFCAAGYGFAEPCDCWKSRYRPGAEQ